MKNFLDLLATDCCLEIVIESAQGSERLSWPLLLDLDLTCEKPTKVSVDGMDVIDFGYWNGPTWTMKLQEPFYPWRHRVTGQGWLLEPVKA